jgi:hypothetical protein
MLGFAGFPADFVIRQAAREQIPSLSCSFAKRRMLGYAVFCMFSEQKRPASKIHSCKKPLLLKGKKIILPEREYEEGKILTNLRTRFIRIYRPVEKMSRHSPCCLIHLGSTPLFKTAHCILG